MKKFALLTTFLTGVSAHVTDCTDNSEKILGAKSTFSLKMTDVAQIQQAFADRAAAAKAVTPSLTDAQAVMAVCADPGVTCDDTTATTGTVSADSQLTTNYLDASKCYKVVIGHDAWRVVYRNTEGISDCERPATNTDGDEDDVDNDPETEGNLILLSGGFDELSGNPIPDTGVHSITHGKTYLGQSVPETAIEAIGPADIVEGLADKFTCKDCAGFSQFTGAEELNTDGKCVLTVSSVNAYIKDLQDKLEEAEADAVSADLDNILNLLNEVLDPNESNATDAAEKAKASIESIQLKLKDFTGAKTEDKAEAAEALRVKMEDLKTHVASFGILKYGSTELESLVLNDDDSDGHTIDELISTLHQHYQDLKLTTDGKDTKISLLNLDIQELETYMDNVQVNLDGLYLGDAAGTLAETAGKAKNEILDLRGEINTISGHLAEYAGADVEKKAEAAKQLETDFDNLETSLKQFSMTLHTTLTHGDADGKRTHGDLTDDSAKRGLFVELFTKLEADYKALSAHATGKEQDLAAKTQELKDFKLNEAALAAEYRLLTSQCTSFGN